MGLIAGTRLGPYEIVSPLGAGGMGEVYRARDTKLQRDVAIKVLPDAVAADPDRLARFEREAQALAALNHPNIAAVYAVEGLAIVMELVAGEDLSAHISRGPIPLAEALPLARQIADALAAAHDAGIVHRDLKPANVMVKDDGTVKVLDFGLAKALAPDGANATAEAMNSPTLTARATQLGMILGTAAYMAPEQAKGKVVDKRADIWAFGVVLFEMLTGRRVFPGEDVSDTLAAVLRAEPDWTQLPAATPPAIRRLLRHCLEKDRKRRLADIADALLEIQDALTTPADGTATVAGALPARGIRRERFAWSAAVLSLAVVAAVAIGWVVSLSRGSAQSDAPAIRLSLTPPAGWSFPLGTTSEGGGISPLAVSPDGRTIAFVARNAEGKDFLWVRALDGAPLQLTGTEGASQPFWSPDSRVLGFFADAKLKTIDASGGNLKQLCPAALPRGGAWGGDDVILFSPLTATGLLKVSAKGGAPTPATAFVKGETSHFRPAFLPDGRHFLYLASTMAVYVASLDSTERTLAIERSDSSNVTYSRGHLLFLRETTLMALPFDPDRRAKTGEAFPVADQVETDGTLPGYGHFSASADGVLAYLSGASGANTQLIWFDRAGQPAGLLGQPGNYANVRLSPDAKHVAVSVLDPSLNTRDIYVLDMKGQPSRFTFDPGDEISPIWSPDGTQIVFGSNRNQNRDRQLDLYEKALSGAAAEQLFLGDSANKTAHDWSFDGKFILYATRTESGQDLWARPLAGDRKPFPVVNTPASEFRGAISPDPARWVAYESDRSGSGRYEVWVSPFPGPGEAWPVSSEGGSDPKWGPGGKELFYISKENSLMAVTVKAEGTGFQVVATEKLFHTCLRLGMSSPYDVALDGRHFLMNCQIASAAASPFTVVVNWTAGLKK